MVAESVVLVAVEAAYRQHFEVEAARASISFLGVDPIEVLRFAAGDTDGRTQVDHYLSLGMSRFGMSDPSALVVDEATAPRAEVMLTAAARPPDLWRKLAVLAAAPAVEGAVYAVGNRVDLGEPLCSGSRCTGVVLGPGPLRPVVVSGSASVEILQLLPATQTEFAWARVHGSDALTERWSAAGTDLHDLLRDPVDLS